MIWEIGGRGGLGSVSLVVVGGFVVFIVVEMGSEGTGGVCFGYFGGGVQNEREMVYGCWMYACGIPPGPSQVGLASIYSQRDGK